MCKPKQGIYAWHWIETHVIEVDNANAIALLEAMLLKACDQLAYQSAAFVRAEVLSRVIGINVKLLELVSLTGCCF